MILHKTFFTKHTNSAHTTLIGRSEIDQGPEASSKHQHMKDHVEIGHLTKYDAFRVNRDQVTYVSNFETASPAESHKLLKFFMISVILFKMSRHSDFHLIFFQIEGAWQDFTVVTKLIKNFTSLYGFGGRFLKIRNFCMDFESYFKVHNLVSVYPKSIILGQMIFHVVVLVYR